jgi:hypothetical protein
MARGGMKRFALGACFAATLGMAVVYASAFLAGGAPAVMVPVMIVSIATLMIALMAVGAARDGRLGRLKWPLASAWLIVVAGFGIALVLPAETPLMPRILLGLPRRAAVIMYGIGLLPLIAMPFAYAWTFDDATLSEADLQRLREQAAALLAREAAQSSG